MTKISLTTTTDSRKFSLHMSPAAIRSHLKNSSFKNHQVLFQSINQSKQLITRNTPFNAHPTAKKTKMFTSILTNNLISLKKQPLQRAPLKRKNNTAICSRKTTDIHLLLFLNEENDMIIKNEGSLVTCLSDDAVIIIDGVGLRFMGFYPHLFGLNMRRFSSS